MGSTASVLQMRAGIWLALSSFSLIVGHLLQKQSSCRRSPGGHIQSGVAITRQELFEFGYRQLPLTDLYQYSDDTSYHPPQEMRRFDAKNDHISLRMNVCAVNHYDG